jgi:hypothetical protein
MTNSAQQLIYQAAMQLEENGDVDEAEATLRDAISLSEIAGRPLEHIQATTFLAELLMTVERGEEALVLFEEVLALARNFPDDPELISEEVAAANDYLRQSAGAPSPENA